MPRTGTAQPGEGLQFRASLLEPLAQDELATEPHIDLQTELFPRPGFTMRHAAGHELVRKESSPPGSTSTRVTCR